MRDASPNPLRDWKSYRTTRRRAGQDSDVVLVNLCRRTAKRRIGMGCNSAVRQVPHRPLSGIVRILRAQREKKRGSGRVSARRKVKCGDVFARQGVSSKELDSSLLSMTYTILAQYGVSSELPPNVLMPKHRRGILRLRCRDPRRVAKPLRPG